MSIFTDRLVAAGVPLSIANTLETSLKGDIARAKAEKQRLTTLIDAKTAEVDALKVQRNQQNAIIDNIRTALADPTA